MRPKQNTEAFWNFLSFLKGLIQSLLKAKQFFALLAWWDHPGAPFLEQDFAVPSVTCQTKGDVSQWTDLPQPLDSSPSRAYGSSDLHASSLATDPSLRFLTQISTHSQCFLLLTHCHAHYYCSHNFLVMVYSRTDVQTQGRGKCSMNLMLAHGVPSWIIEHLYLYSWILFWKCCLRSV